jgi:ATP-dependent Clp protease protease subunit
MIHQPSGGYSGTAADVEVAAREILYIRERLNGIIAKHTGQTAERVADDVDRDRFMGPEEAVEYGLIDRVLHGPVQQLTGKPADSDSPEAES